MQTFFPAQMRAFHRDWHICNLAIVFMPACTLILTKWSIRIQGCICSGDPRAELEKGRKAGDLSRNTFTNKCPRQLIQPRDIYHHTCAVRPVEVSSKACAMRTAANEMTLSSMTVTRGWGLTRTPFALSRPGSRGAGAGAGVNFRFSTMSAAYCVVAMRMTWSPALSHLLPGLSSAFPSLIIPARHFTCDC